MSTLDTSFLRGLYCAVASSVMVAHRDFLALRNGHWAAWPSILLPGSQLGSSSFPLHGWLSRRWFLAWTAVLSPPFTTALRIKLCIVNS